MRYDRVLTGTSMKINNICCTAVSDKGFRRISLNMSEVSEQSCFPRVAHPRNTRIHLFLTRGQLARKMLKEKGSEESQRAGVP